MSFHERYPEFKRATSPFFSNDDSTVREDQERLLCQRKSTLREEHREHPYYDVQGQKFNAVIGLIIFANAVLISFETDMREGSWLFVFLENTFAAIFVGEMLMRMWQLGGAWRKDTWNLFDALLVTISVVNILFPVIFGGHGHASAFNTMVLRLCRLLRVLRILRLFRMFRDLLLILEAFEQGMKVVLWLGTLILLLDWVCAIVLTQVIGHNADLWAEVGKEDLILKWFGTIWASMGSLFIVMTLAEWDIMVYTISEVLPSVPVFMGFMIYILVCSYTMVSLITSIISESLVSAQQADVVNKMRAIEEERERFAHELTQILESLDANGNGFIEHEEVAYVLASNPEIFTRLAALDINIDQNGILKIVDRLNEGGKGVYIPMLVEFLTSVTGQAKASSIVELKYDLKASMNAIVQQLTTCMAEVTTAVRATTGAAAGKQLFYSESSNRDVDKEGQEYRKHQSVDIGSTGMEHFADALAELASMKQQLDHCLRHQLEDAKKKVDGLCASVNVRDDECLSESWRELGREFTRYGRWCESVAERSDCVSIGKKKTIAKALIRKRTPSTMSLPELLAERVRPTYSTPQYPTSATSDFVSFTFSSPSSPLSHSIIEERPTPNRHQSPHFRSRSTEALSL